MGQLFRSDRGTFATIDDPALMAERVMSFAPASDAEALKLLRASFPDSPLRLRVAALDFLMRRRSGTQQFLKP
jgi:hypothetical protein